MSALRRVTTGLRTVATNPVERRAYAGRLKWLLNGSGSLQAWSLEYRAGLTGRFAFDADRKDPDELVVIDCPTDCGAHAPLAHLYQRRHVFGLHGSIASTATGATLLTSTPEPAFFVRESITWPFESILSHGLDIPEAKDAQPGPEGPTVVFPTNSNYYHWLIEELPLVIRAKRAYPDVRAVAYGPAITERHRTVSNALNIRLDGTPLVLSFANQILPGRRDDSWFVHPKDARLLFELGRQITASSQVEAHDRIWVSRRNSTRSIAVEAELEALLADQGFTIVTLESMSWEQQISLFRNARIVAGLHGAGLANLVFTGPGATLIELTNGFHYNRCFEFIAHVAGHDYQMIPSDDRTGISARDLAQAILANSN